VVRKSTCEDSERLLTFLQEEGPARQFFPAYEASDFSKSSRRLLGLRPESVLLAHVDGQLVGTLGVWDQLGFKQNIVRGYSKRLSLCRPYYNCFAALRGKPKLPKVGERLNLRYATIPVVAGDHPDIVECLIQAAITELREQSGDLLMIGLHEADPLLPFIRPYSGREYATLLYLVYWPEEIPDFKKLSDRVPYLELGCL